jgi:hypothetical protein
MIAVTRKRPAALHGERKDLNRMKLAIPARDAAPTMIVIVISVGENCPLRR